MTFYALEFWVILIILLEFKKMSQLTKRDYNCCDVFITCGYLEEYACDGYCNSFQIISTLAGDADDVANSLLSYPSNRSVKW